ncbi:MAG: LuxR C-terminal-related transcriptional regulator [Solirubrobacteraceae bacterium]
MINSPAPPRQAYEIGHNGLQRVRVLVADGDGFARRSVQDAVHRAEGLVMVAAARDVHETLELAGHYRPDVMIMDTALFSGDCSSVITHILAASPDTRILTVSSDGDEAALAALRAGAVGHSTKDVDPENLIGLVLRIADGEAVVPRRLVMPLLKYVHAVPRAGWRPVRSRLTTREWEIIEMLTSGASTKHIAGTLVLSATTVYSHIKSIMRKLGVHSRRDAVAAAERLRREEAMRRNLPTSLR